ncbi:hypothetical protein ACFLY7_00880 [Patescibacteria group bacterium]
MKKTFLFFVVITSVFLTACSDKVFRSEIASDNQIVEVSSGESSNDDVVISFYLPQKGRQSDNENSPVGKDVQLLGTLLFSIQAKDGSFPVQNRKEEIYCSDNMCSVLIRREEIFAIIYAHINIDGKDYVGNAYFNGNKPVFIFLMNDETDVIVGDIFVGDGVITTTIELTEEDSAIIFRGLFECNIVGQKRKYTQAIILKYGENFLSIELPVQEDLKCRLSVTKNDASFLIYTFYLRILPKVGVGIGTGIWEVLAERYIQYKDWDDFLHFVLKVNSPVSDAQYEVMLCTDNVNPNCTKANIEETVPYVVRSFSHDLVSFTKKDLTQEVKGICIRMFSENLNEEETFCRRFSRLIFD